MATTEFSPFVYKNSNFKGIVQFQVLHQNICFEFPGRASFAWFRWWLQQDIVWISSTHFIRILWARFEHVCIVFHLSFCVIFSVASVIVSFASRVMRFVLFPRSLLLSFVMSSLSSLILLFTFTFSSVTSEMHNLILRDRVHGHLLAYWPGKVPIRAMEFEKIFSMWEKSTQTCVNRTSNNLLLFISPMFSVMPLSVVTWFTLHGFFFPAIPQNCLQKRQLNICMWNNPFFQRKKELLSHSDFR